MPGYHRKSRGWRNAAKRAIDALRAFGSGFLKPPAHQRRPLVAICEPESVLQRARLSAQRVVAEHPGYAGEFVQFGDRMFALII